MLTKNKQVKLNKRCLLICNLPVAVLFTVLKSVTFQIKQTHLRVAKRHTRDGQADPSPRGPNKNIEIKSKYMRHRKELIRNTNKIEYTHGRRRENI
jgi:hypothetical protein